MPEGVLEFNPSVKPLQAISPSRLTSLKQCALREVWSASSAPRLLPLFPAARLGSVIHRLLQEAGEGHFAAGDPASVERRWQQLIRVTEQTMCGSWLERHLVPLRDVVADYEVRRIQTQKRALEIAAAANSRERAGEGKPTNAFGFEIPVSSPDDRIRGYIDAVIQSMEGPVIRDYKSGKMLEGQHGEAGTLIEAYQAQLKLYAALYAVTRGSWPARIEVVPLAGSPKPVPFDATACLRLLDEAQAELERVNGIIAQASSDPGELQRRLATPSPASCAHCPFRPGCIPYRLAATSVSPELGWPRDLWGRLEEIRELGNSRLLLVICTQDRLARVRKVSPDPSRHPALVHLQIGNNLAIFNLNKGGSKNAFLESRFTVTYLVP